MLESTKNSPLSYIEKLNTTDIWGENIDDNKKETQDVREKALSFLDENLKNIPDNYKINLINEIVDLLEKLENAEQDIQLECRNRLNSLNKNIKVNKASWLEEEIEKMDFTWFNEQEILILKDVSRFLDITKLTKIQNKEKLMKFLMTDIVKPIIITQIGDLLDYKIINNEDLLELIKKDDTWKIIAKMSFGEINKLINSGILDKELNWSNNSTNLEKIYEKVKNDPEKWEMINFIEKNSNKKEFSRVYIMRLSEYLSGTDLKWINNIDDFYKLMLDNNYLWTLAWELIIDLNLFGINTKLVNEKKEITNKTLDPRFLSENTELKNIYEEILDSSNDVELLNWWNEQHKNTLELLNKCIFETWNFDIKSDISDINLNLFFRLIDEWISKSNKNINLKNRLIKIKSDYNKKYDNDSIKESIKNLNENEKVFLKKYLPNKTPEELKSIQKEFGSILEKYSYIDKTKYPDLFSFKNDLNSFFEKYWIKKRIENTNDILNLRVEVNEDKLNQDKLYLKNKEPLNKLKQAQLNEIREKLVNPSLNLIEFKKELLDKYWIELYEETSLEEIKELFKQVNELKTTKIEKKLAEKNWTLNQEITQDNSEFLSRKLWNTQAAVEKLMNNWIEIDQKFLESENWKKIIEATKLPKVEFEKKLVWVQKLIMWDNTIIKNSDFKSIPELAKYSNEQWLEIQKWNSNDEIIVELNWMKSELKNPTFEKISQTIETMKFFEKFWINELYSHKDIISKQVVKNNWEKIFNFDDWINSFEWEKLLFTLTKTVFGNISIPQDKERLEEYYFQKQNEVGKNWIMNLIKEKFKWWKPFNLDNFINSLKQNII